MPYASGQNSTAVAIATTATNSLCTSPTITIPNGGVYQGMNVRGVVNFSAGTAATSAVIKVFQGSGVSGNTVATPLTVTTAAQSVYNVGYDLVDTTPGAAATYTVSLSCPAATGSDGTVHYSTIEIDPVVGF
jgi:hypothetical protein